MRLAFLTLVFGVLLGFSAHSFFSDHPQWALASSPSKSAASDVITVPFAGPEKPIVYPSPERTLARLKKQYDEAVVVVLADESYDDQRHLIHVAVREVWKGPAALVGKTMDSRLEPPLAYAHSEHSERVLRFMPMTPHLDTVGSIAFTGDILRMNPALTVGSLKAALVNAKETNG